MTLPGGGEMIVILLIVVLLFGAKKLPELSRSVGQSITSFKKGVRDAGEEEGGQADAGADEVTTERDRGERDAQ